MIIVLLLVLAAVLPHDIFLDVRLDLGIPLNLLDAGLLLGLLATFLPNKQRNLSVYPGGHPLWRPIVILYLTAVPLALAVGYVKGNLWYFVLAETRDYLGLPLAAWITYRLLQNQISIERFMKVFLILAAVASLILIIATAVKGKQTVQLDDITTIREGNIYGYGVYLMGPAACYALYQFLAPTGFQTLSKFWSIFLAIVCLNGVLFTFYRNSWVAVTVTLVTMLLLLPAGARIRKAFPLLIVGLIGMIMLMVGLWGLSRITQHDLFTPMIERLGTLAQFTSEDQGSGPITAWEGRLTNIFEELDIWIQSPLFGHGFGYWVRFATTGEYGSFKHNVYTSALALGGPLMLTLILVVLFGPMILGKRIVRQSQYLNHYAAGVLIFIGMVFLALTCAMTMSINSPRPAVFAGVMLGFALRARELQLLMAYQPSATLVTNPVHRPTTIPNGMSAPANG